jgi:hypothetical protein
MEGFEGIREAAKDIERRKNSGGGNFEWQLWLKLQENEKATVRFLEGSEGNPVKWAWTHKVPPTAKQKWGDDLPCLDQKRTGVPCPACSSELKVGSGDEAKPIKNRSFNGFINVIWYEAPVFETEEVEIQTQEGPKKVQQNKKDGAGKWIVKDKAPQVAIWNQGITVFEELDGIASTYKGLMSRRFVIARKGTRFNTKYNIHPQDPDGGPQQMSELEQELFGKKYDLTPFVTPLSYEDMAARLMPGDATQVQTPSHNDGSTDVDSISAFM